MQLHSQSKVLAIVFGLTLISTIYTPAQAAPLADPNTPSTSPASKKGLAWAHSEFAQDYDALNVSWWYDWGTTPAHMSYKPGYIPMSFAGQMVSLPADYSGYLLVFNEPNNSAPYGSHLDPAEAAKRYLQLRQAFPQAKLVVGGISIWAIGWLQSFYAAVQQQDGRAPTPAAIAVHSYIEDWITVNEALRRLNEIHDFVQRPIWVTEFGACDGTANTMYQLVNFFENTTWVERYSAFTNRQQGTEPWAICSGTNLFSWNGQITAAGLVYQQAAQMSATGAYRVYLPIAIR